MNNPPSSKNPRQGGQRAQALVMIVFFLAVFCAFAALSVDLGKMYAVKKTLQNGTDAAALAGVMQVVTKPPADTTYVDKARDFANANKVKTERITTIEAGHYDSAGGFVAGGTPRDAVRVAAQAPVPMTFARVLGLTSLPVSARSTAQAFKSDSVTGVALPWVIRFDTNDVVNKCDTFELKFDDPNITGMWTEPNTNLGSDYARRVKDGYEGTLTVGDYIEFVQGSRPGQTGPGVRQRIQADPNSTCATVENSSPRLIIVPFTSAPLPTEHGANMLVRVDGFVVFFLLDTQQGDKIVRGQFQHVFAGKSVSRQPPGPTSPVTAYLVE